MVDQPDTWSAWRHRAETELADSLAELVAMLDQLEAAKRAGDVATVRLIRAALRELVSATADELDELRRLVDLVIHPMFATDG
jgi:DNA-binding FrmR family transcriptional regulator